MSTSKPSASGRPSPPERRISVVLPVYNEGDNIIPCLRGLAAALVGHEHEILVCYDFEGDTTVDAIASMDDCPAEVQLVLNELGRGPANAIRAGFDAATGDVVVTTMADLSDPPDRIPGMAEKIRAGAAVVSGSRYMPGGSQEGGPFLKSLFSLWAGKLMKAIAGLGTSDPTNNFRAYARTFLDSVKVESQTGFDIALELTTKAHLAGKRIDEIPTSWVDRSAGESRFRLWAWMPKYLRWFGRVVAAPIVVALLLPLLAVFFVRTELTEASPLGVAGSLLARLIPVLLFVAFARCGRGRTRIFDALHPLIWFLPGTVGLAAGPYSLHLFALSLLVFVASPGLGRETRAKILARLPNQATLMALVIGALYLLRNYSVGHPVAQPVLDPTWRQAMGYALTHSIPFGPGICFTYGPLGYFSAPAYDPELFWWSQLGWEFGLRGLMAMLFGFALMRVQGAFDRTLCMLGLFANFTTTVVGQLLLMVWLTRWLIQRERSFWYEFGTYLIFAVFGMTKFPNFVFAVFCTGMVCIQGLVRRGGLRGFLQSVGTALFAIVLVWCLAGQNPLNLPEWLSASWQIADVYSETNGWIGPREQLDVGLRVLVLVELGILFAFLRAPRLDRGLIALTAGAYAFLAFKAGFTRHFGNCLMFLCVAPLAGYVMADGVRRQTLFAYGMRILEVSLRSAALITGLAFWATTTASSPHLAPIRLVNGPVTHMVGHWQQIERIESEVAAREEERVELKKQYDMPRTRERIGDRTIDVMGYNQAIVLLNEFNWRPRPIFQSYTTYGGPLFRRNSAHFESDRAPDFVLLEPAPFDHRLVGCEDSAAMQVVLRDYAPVMMERGFVLWERREGAPFERDREVLLEREIGLGEVVELEEFGEGALLLYLDYELPLRGKIRKIVLRAPHFWIHYETSKGVRRRRRVFASMFDEGALIAPHLAELTEVVEWSCGAPTERIIRFRIEADKGLDENLPDRLEMRVERARELDREFDEGLADKLRYSMFEDSPDEVISEIAPRHERQREVHYLRVHADTVLRYELGSGSWRAVGDFAVLPQAYTAHGRSDGADFSLVWVDSEGNERSLYELTLDPRNKKGDRSVQSVDVEFEAESAGVLEFRVGSGPNGDAQHDLCMWRGIAIERAEP